MKSAIEADLIAVCGMNCAVCSSYLSKKNDLKAKGIRLPFCSGCRSRHKNCSFLKKHCSKLSNNEVFFCFECGVFPCDRLKRVDNRYQELYHMSLIVNLKLIKEIGLENFLFQQEKAWKCPTCGELICCHNGLCYNCQIEELKNKKEKYRW